MTSEKYTTSLAKGQGMLEETLALLKVWKPGMSAQDLAAVAIKEGTLSRATAKRTRDMVLVQFAPRYLYNGSRPALQIKTLLDLNISFKNLQQIFLIHTARANPILYDYICEVYWPIYRAGRETISKHDSLHFLENAVNTGQIVNRWSDKMMERVASYLGGCLADFGLTEAGRKGTRRLIQFKIISLTTLYLAHDIHFSGYSDNGVLDHPDWKLFGMEKMDVVNELKRVSNGHFIPQFSGELMRISWNYKTMEEALHAIVATEL